MGKTSVYANFKKAGEIHKIVEEKLKDTLISGMSALEITEFIENEIKNLVQYNDNDFLKGGVGFPVGVNINNIVAHFTPSKKHNPIIKNDDLVKIDFGVHIDGCISDGAFSWCPSGKYDELIEIAEEATDIAIKNSGNDVFLSEIGEFIEEYIESKEIYIDGKEVQIRSITDICGHKILPFEIHGGKAVPNGKINFPYKAKMQEGEFYAIEPYPTTGKKDIINSEEINHFAISKPDSRNKKLYDKFKTIPFCPRWVDSDIPQSSNIQKYPVILNDGIVAQYEKSIYVKDNGVEILN
jgi:methionyl aminopeptidase